MHQARHDPVRDDDIVQGEIALHDPAASFQQGFQHQAGIQFVGPLGDIFDGLGKLVGARGHHEAQSAQVDREQGRLAVPDSAGS